VTISFSKRTLIQGVSLENLQPSFYLRWNTSD